MAAQVMIGQMLAQQQMLAMQQQQAMRMQMAEAMAARRAAAEKSQRQQAIDDAIFASAHPGMSARQKQAEKIRQQIADRKERILLKRAVKSQPVASIPGQ
jgi:hypothetical protein